MLNPEMTDEETVEQVPEGKHEAYRLVVERYEKVIFNLMFRMCGSTGESTDLTQDVLVKAFEKSHTFNKNKKFFPWLYTIRMNHAKNFLRQRQTHSTYNLDDLDQQTGSEYLGQEEDAFCDRLDAQLVYQAPQKIPLDYREAVILRYRDGHSMQDIADLLGLSISAIKMRVYRGLEKVRQLLLKGNSHDKNRQK